MPKSDLDDTIDRHKISDLREEMTAGLRIYAETAWGWSELKVAPLLRQVEKSGGVIMGYTEIRRCGGITLKIPRRV